MALFLAEGKNSMGKNPEERRRVVLVLLLKERLCYKNVSLRRTAIAAAVASYLP